MCRNILSESQDFVETGGSDPGMESSKRSEQQVPSYVYQSVYDGGRKDAARLAPRAAVEDSRNRRKQRVAPVGKHAIVRNMREAENHGGRDPAPLLACQSARERILQQT